MFENHPNLLLVEYDLMDLPSSIRFLQTPEETEIYNLAAQSFVWSHLISQWLGRR